MKSILFVEEETNVLDGLRRMLHSYRNEWQMEFLQSGSAAIERMAESPVDVLVTDVMVGGANGQSLLAEASQQSPSTVRIVLSADVDRESWLAAAGTAHQYVPMPCEPDSLKQIITRASAVRERFADASVQEIVGQVKALPALPSVYQELLQELRSPDASIDRVGEIISQDVAMSAKVLQLVKSSYFGLQQEVNDAQHAVVLLGLKLVGSLVLAAGVFEQFDSTALKRFQLDNLMQESVKAARIAQRIAEQCCKQVQISEDCLLAGMLQDIGKLILAAYLTDQYAEALALCDNDGLTVEEAETQVFGANHADVGGYLLDLWGFGSQVVEGVTFHHAPSQSGGDSFSALTAVHLANALATSENGASVAEIAAKLDSEYLAQLHVGQHLSSWQQAAGQADDEQVD